jgi:hypothetical protein
VPITYFGSAWATLGLVRSVPAPPDTPARRQRAFDVVRAFHGTYEVDEAAADRPVVSVDLRVYGKMDDGALGDIAERLRAFPRLGTLRLKSPQITDAGLAHLRHLPQLRIITLANTAITDAGLETLKAFTALEAVDLRGTKVTDAGVQHFQKERPRVTVER